MYTKKQLARFWYQTMDRVQKDYGYQPYGFDWQTMNVCRPGLLPAYQRLSALYKHATEQGFNELMNREFEVEPLDKKEITLDQLDAASR